MTRSLTFWRCLVAATVGICGVITVSASARPGTTADPVYAVVDVEKLSNDYKARQSFEKEITTMQDRFNARLARRDNLPLLSQDEHNKYDELAEKDADKQTAADKKAMDDLNKKGLDAATAFRALQQKNEKDLTPADKDAMKKVEADITSAKTSFEKMRGDLEKKILDYRQKQVDDLKTKVKASIAKVAKEKGISLVFSSEMVLFASTDITTPVLSDLNK